MHNSGRIAWIKSELRSAITRPNTRTPRIIQPDHSNQHWRLSVMSCTEYHRNELSQASPQIYLQHPAQVDTSPRGICMVPSQHSNEAHISLQHVHGKLFEAPGEEYEAAEQFCQVYPVSLPRTLPSYVIDQIHHSGATVWGIEQPTLKRFSGTITATVNPGVVRVQSKANCGDTCLMSDLPILAGLYDIRGQRGVYYEIMINRMEGIIAIGTPIPHFTSTINLKPTCQALRVVPIQIFVSQAGTDSVPGCT